MNLDPLGLGEDRLPLIDAHTHTSGAEHDGPADGILRCLDACGIERVFVFAPLLSQQGLQLVDHHLDDIRRHNDYVAHLCSHEPDRLIGFAVVNPNPAIAGGDAAGAAERMAEELRRCYHELGLRGVKMVPDRWTAEDEAVHRLFQEVADLGMYAVFHTGIFMDERSSTYCRPSFFEGLHRIEGFHGQLAHLGWPWVDETIGVLAMESEHPEPGDGDTSQLKADFSFGAPPDWQVDSLVKTLNEISARQLIYGSDLWWPMTPETYLEQYLLPHLSAFEVAATLSRKTPEQGSDQRPGLRRNVFRDNAWEHWLKATRGVPQRPSRARTAPKTPNARAGGR